MTGADILWLLSWAAFIYLIAVTFVPAAGAFFIGAFAYLVVCNFAQSLVLFGWLAVFSLIGEAVNLF